MTYPNKRLSAILAGAVGILLIPLVAMQFTTEVNWSGFDFVVAAILLVGTGLMIELILRTIKHPQLKKVLLALMVILLLLLWAELAVGVFGSPLAGS